MPAHRKRFGYGERPKPGIIRDYEQGNREPVLRCALKLAGVLGVSVEALAKAAQGNRKKNQ
jgi:hypothetical protein